MVAIDDVDDIVKYHLLGQTQPLKSEHKRRLSKYGRSM